MLVVIVETEEAANVRGIMALPGVDVALIGPGDLMVDVKAHGHEDHEALEAAAAAPERGVAAGYAAPWPEIAARRVAQAFGCIQDALDHVVLLGGFGEIARLGAGPIPIGHGDGAACRSSRLVGRVTIRERRVAGCRKPAAAGSRAWSARRS